MNEKECVCYEHVYIYYIQTKTYLLYVCSTGFQQLYRVTPSQLRAQTKHSFESANNMHIRQMNSANKSGRKGHKVGIFKDADTTQAAKLIFDGRKSVKLNLAEECFRAYSNTLLFPLWPLKSIKHPQNGSRRGPPRKINHSRPQSEISFSAKRKMRKSNAISRLRKKRVIVHCRAHLSHSLFRALGRRVVL